MTGVAKNTVTKLLADVGRACAAIGMNMRRLTRPTNSFAKKAENLAAAVAVHFMHYNFGRIHQSVRVTPAMAAGVSDHVWEIDEIVSLLDADRSAHRVASPN